MQPRFVGRVGVADAVSVANAVLGFLAVLAASADPELAARLVLLAAILDAVDGIVARRFGATSVGRPLDSLADVSSFAVAPAVVVVAVARTGSASLSVPDAATVAAVVAAGAYVGAAVLRLALYTVDDAGEAATTGVQSTLAGTILAAAVLARVVPPAGLVGAAAALSYLMVVPVRYPDLRARDALAAGTVQSLAVLAPAAFARLFPRVVLVLALAYFALAPFVYPGPNRDGPDDASGGDVAGAGSDRSTDDERDSGGDGGSAGGSASGAGSGDGRVDGGTTGEDGTGAGRNRGVRAGGEGKR